MLVARLHAATDLRLAEEPPPQPGADEELLRVTAVGLCGSDRHWFVEGAIGDARLERPLVLGHEIAGVVESGPRRGQRVCVDPADPCRECATCRAGQGHLCARMRFLGHGTNDGGLRELLSWPARLMLPVPNSIGDHEAALLEPLGVALHAVDLARLEHGESAAVIGCGPIGLLLIQVLRDAGCAAVYAADPLPHRIGAARALGATVVDELPPVAVAFDVSGAPAAVDLAVSAAAPGGRIVLVGIPDDDLTTFPASVARRKELTLMVCRRMRAADLARAIELAASGRVELAPLLREAIPLTEVDRAFGALVAYEGIKTVVVPD